MTDVNKAIQKDRMSFYEGKHSPSEIKAELLQLQEVAETVRNNKITLTAAFHQKLIGDLRNLEQALIVARRGEASAQPTARKIKVPSK